MRHIISVIIVLVNILQAVQSEPWLIGPCKSFERLKEKNSDWFKGITVAECLERCQNRGNSVREPLRLDFGLNADERHLR